jgi:NAD(P)-dependent dehydrogenase (short-subunit alcohol dehydrogenase family)
MAAGAINSEFRDGATLVVGGTGGIGTAVCRVLAESGHNVAFSYFANQKMADDLLGQIEGTGCDGLAVQINAVDPISLKVGVEKVISKFGAIHSVVYAAGPSLEFLYINEIDPAEWARVMNTDVNGCFNLISAILPHFRARKAGNIVALVTAAVDRAPPRDILSAAPKAAIQMLIRGVAREEGRSGIRANCVGPGYIEAGLGLTTLHGHTADYVERMVKAIPLGRAGSAKDVADVVAFLLSDKARYVTGETIHVAGGLQLV